jgi:rfaE bifunctional protein nucleotidyltransferase chain/domain
MKSSTLDIIRKKILHGETLKHQLGLWRFFSHKIVFTNGCFDLLHLGHIDYLSKAADLGDALIVGVNTDDSTRRLKGPHRPVNNQQQRSMIIASLHFVDAVVLFEEDTPYELIKIVQPDVLVKGSDYNPSNISGADIVLAKGGSVQTIDFLPGYSSTGVEKRILEAKR